MKFITNSPLFEYDIRGLLMAFYPWTKFETDEKAEDAESLSVTFTGDLSEKQGVCSCRLDFRDGAFSKAKEVHLDLSDRKSAKSLLKRTLYGILSEASGKTLPWGTLTGIRPTKIPMAMLREETKDADILRHMTETLLCSEGKAELSLEIAKRELSLLRGLDTEDGWSLYIGIPFCPTTCLYCSFTSYPIDRYKGRISAYLDALEKELRFTAEAFRGKTLFSVYFGGGTPTALPAEELDRLLRLVTQLFDLSHVREWTVEAGRPDSVTEEKLSVMRNYPVTRISVNPQTMHQKTLDLIGRKHTVEDVLNVYRMARARGFDNINMDLILGLPGETEADVRETIRRVSDLAPDNVTIHSLAIKRAARLNLMKDVYRNYTMENTDESMAMCREALRDIGLSPYYLYRQKNMAGNLENTGYASPGKEGVYNILIMEEVHSIVACGAGATTKRVRHLPDGDLITRAENVKNVDLYMENVEEMIARKKALFFGE